ncbi:MAG: diguanylate cyclase [Thioalkalivibrio sp.]
MQTLTQVACLESFADPVIPVAVITADRFGTIVHFNEVAAGLLQLEDRRHQGVPLTDLIAPDDPAFFESLLAHAQSQGAALAQEVACVDTDGRPFVVDLQMAHAQGGGERFLFTISERLGRRPSGSGTDGLLRHFYDLHVLGMAIITPHKRRWLQVNDRLCEILGYSREELSGRAWDDVIDPEERHQDRMRFAQLWANGSGAYTGATRFLHRDGHAIHGHVVLRGVHDVAGGLQCCLVTLQDLTQVQEAIHEARQQHRLQTMMVHVNQTIVRNRGLKSLFQDVCRISVADGGFSACWIGIWDRDDTRNLRVFARFGDDVGDVDPSHSADEWQGEANPLVVNDLLQEAQLPGSRAALEAGRRSLARFSIGQRGVLGGTVNLFADQAGFFTPAVVSTLAEMVEDLSVALDRITATEALERANKVVESSPVVLCQRSPAPGWPLGYISSNVARWGFSAKQLILEGRLFMDLIHPDDRQRVTTEVVEHLGHRQPRYRQEYRVVTGTGESIWIDDHTRVEYDPQGWALSLEGVLTDITPRKQAEQREASRSHVLALLAQRAQLPIILETLAREVELERPDMRCSIMLVDVSQQTLVMGAAPNLPTFYCRAIEGTPVKEGIGSCGHAAATGKVAISEDIQVDPRWAGVQAVAQEAGLAACWSAPILSSGGQVLGTFAIYHEHIHSPSEADIQLIQDKANLAAIAIERTRDAEALRESAERWQFALEGAGDGVWDWDLDTNKVDYSSHCMDMLEISAAADPLCRHEQWIARVHPDDLEHLNENLWSHLDGHLPHFACEHRVRTDQGGWKWILSRGLVVRRDAHGKPLRMVGTITDISERKRMEQELREMATTDYLTGLSNRRHFLGRVTEELARLKRSGGHQAAMMLLDLDYFKAVNDTYGHSAGDAVLRRFAQLMRDGLRKMDVPGRVGGEEFSVLLPDTDIDAALHLAERLRTMVAEAPVQFNDQQIPVTVSIGLTLLTQADASPDDALQRADAALYRAKDGGRNRVEVLSAGG